MYRKQTSITHFGKLRSITDFNWDMEHNLVSGNISGKYVEADTSGCRNAACAKHKLIREHDSKYGDSIMSTHERAIYANSFANPNDIRVRYKSKKRDDGSLIVKGEVDNTTLTLSYDGIVISEYFETSKGRPFRRKIREDLVRKYNEMKEKENMTSYCYQTIPVDDELKLFLNERKFIIFTDDDGTEAIAIGSKTIKIDGDQFDVLRQITVAVEEEIQKRNEKLSKIAEMRNHIDELIGYKKGA